MRRRDFIFVVAGGVTAWPLGAAANERHSLLILRCGS
jgi:hypothetical protein